ncbi:Type IV secretory pathway, VirD4 component [Dissulfuribacter thermophilus]|uniref:Type IV secretory pathway, VirD4 component n=1 Tax=Dissulfuribacter thermophilus TaxID=1156395 RepID=A0A1B9F653_9BACT|nr:TraM recognition domain-containing protein [Dissulfuribacter thermophilus]OCC15314.1 Type IV secretory pathway, VirD4 component [Dissulfuribacter thermophilus]
MIELFGRLLQWKNDKKFRIGTGIYLKDLPYPEATKLNIDLPEKFRNGHVGIFGTTRSGKTRLAENLIEWDIRQGKSVWIIDPKGDIELLSKIIQTCILTNRLDHFYFFSPFHLDISVKINPLAYWVIPEEIVHHVASSIASGKGDDADFFYKVSKEVLLVVVRSLQVLDVIAGRTPEFNLVRLNHFISYTDLKKLYTQLKQLTSSVGTVHLEGQPVKQIIENELLPKLAQMLAQKEDHFSKVSGSLRTELSQLTLGTINRLFSDVKENPIFERLINNQPTVFYCSTASLITRDTANIVGKIILSGLQSISGHFNAEGKKFNPPLAVHVDEASNVLYPGMDDLFNKAGGTNVHLTLLTQSLADFETAIGKAYCQKILDNLNTQIWLRTGSKETALYVADKAGKIKTYSPTLSIGGFSTAREMEKKVLSDTALTEFKPREFVAFIYEQSYMGYTSTVSPLHLNLIMPTLKWKKPSKNDSPAENVQEVLSEPDIKRFRRRYWAH